MAIPIYDNHAKSTINPTTSKYMKVGVPSQSFSKCSFLPISDYTRAREPRKG